VRRRLLLRAERQTLAAFRQVQFLVFSNDLGRALRRNFGVPASCVRVLPPGINLTRFHPVPSGAAAGGIRPDVGSLRLVFAAHNFALKGLHCVFPALAELRRSGILATVAVAGGGPVRRFRRLASRSGVEAHVEFLGAVDQETLAATYRGSHGLIHPTFYDPFPRVVLEALACGCPVITTRRCGASALIESGREGFLIDDPRNTRDLVAAVRLLAEPARLAELRERASLVGGALSFESHARRMLSCLNLAG
jgi:UDP-glucose:(heptosyl)LPS alpha-1,3-glucosyltransferase